MCIAVFIWKSHPLYPFLLLLNRDEYHNRPTTPLGWWEDGDHIHILGGRDGQGGGNWLACTRDGKLAFLTNVREIKSRPSSQQQQQQVKIIKSRGELPIRFLKGTKSPKEFGEEIVGEADEFNGFNLIVADLIGSMTMVYITNRPKADDGSGSGSVAEEVSPGIHVLSNAKLDTPWPKAQKLRRSFEDVVRKCFDGEIINSVKERGEIILIMKDTTKDDDERELPGIYPPDIEYQLSSIFVEPADMPLGRYGTRSTSAVQVVRRGGGVVVSFYERNLENEDEDDVWKEQTISFHIETEKIGSEA